MISKLVSSLEHASQWYSPFRAGAAGAADELVDAEEEDAEEEAPAWN